MSGNTRKESYENTSIVLADLREALVDMDLDKALGTAQNLLEDKGITLDMKDPQHRVLLLELLKADMSILEEVKKRSEGTWEEPQTAQTIQKETTEETKEDSKTLQELTELYLRDLNTSVTQEKDYRSFFSGVLFELIDPETPISNINRETILGIREQIQALPKRSLQKYKGVSIKDLLDMTIPEEDKQSIRNINKQLSWISSVFLVVTKYQLVAYNPAIDLKIKSKVTNAQKEREQFTKEELAKIFKALGDDPRADTIGIQLYTGMIMSELLKAKIEVIDGIKCIDLRDGELKNAHRPRVIPMPSNIAHINQEDLEKLQGLMTSSDTYRSWFNNKIVKRHVIDSPKKVNYSLRHSFATELQANEVSEEVTTALMGHSFKSMSYSRYAKGYPVSVLKEAVDKLGFNY